MKTWLSHPNNWVIGIGALAVMAIALPVLGYAPLVFGQVVVEVIGWFFFSNIAETTTPLLVAKSIVVCIAILGYISLVLYNKHTRH
jgi:hypothetical protein